MTEFVANKNICIYAHIGKALCSGRKCQSAWSMKEKFVYDHGGGGGGGSFFYTVVIYVTVGVMKAYNGCCLFVFCAANAACAALDGQ